MPKCEGGFTAVVLDVGRVYGCMIKRKEPLPSEIALKRISHGRVDLTKQSMLRVYHEYEKGLCSLFIQRRNVSPGHVSDSPASRRSMLSTFRVNDSER